MLRALTKIQQAGVAVDKLIQIGKSYGHYLVQLLGESSQCHLWAATSQGDSPNKVHIQNSWHVLKLKLNVKCYHTFISVWLNFL